MKALMKQERSLGDPAHSLEDCGRCVEARNYMQRPAAKSAKRPCALQQQVSSVASGFDNGAAPCDYF
jgi:hypothetical protein